MRPPFGIALVLAWFANFGVSQSLLGQTRSPSDVRGNAGTATPFPTDHIFEQWRILETSLFNKAHVLATFKQIAFNPSEGPDKPLEPAWTQKWKVDRDGDNFVLQIAGKGRSFDHVLCRNPKYDFDIRRGGEGEAWRINRFENTAYIATLPTEASNRFLNFLRAPYDVWNYPVEALFSSSRLKNAAAASDGVGAKEVVTVNFQLAGDPASEENIDCIEGGVIRFEPARHWAIRDFDLRIRPAMGAARRAQTVRVTKRCTYRSAGSIEPAEVQFDLEMLTGKQARRVNRWTVTIDEVRPSELTAKEYTLPAFGVMEPPLPGSRSPLTSRWFWMLQAGVFVLVIGLLLRRRAKI